MNCDIVGVGAWGEGFKNSSELHAILDDSMLYDAKSIQLPKPERIPGNERRRAPLPVKMAIEVSDQAISASGISPAEVACVFGSGLGDTEITDYMCRVLTTEAKQLSPTKFHNSVHNAAVGYWTISTQCMKAANSIAAYFHTAAQCLLEAMVQCEQEQSPVLVTLFDTPAHAAYRDVFECAQGFAAAIVLCPQAYTDADKRLARLSACITEKIKPSPDTLEYLALRPLFQTNPAAKILPLLEALVFLGRSTQHPSIQMHLSETMGLSLHLQAPH